MKDLTISPEVLVINLNCPNFNHFFTMNDFTIKLLTKFYKALKSQGFSFIYVSDILQNNEIFSKYVILRHDVEKYYENVFEFARIQNELGIRGVYYFRISDKHFKPDVVEQIANLGHEAGYHYDYLTQCEGNYDLAIKRFKKNLNMLREIATVKTICMDGSPLSKFDNKALWEKYNYHDYGIIGEPYFDIDFDEVFYLTDTGRRWDGWKVNVRDKMPQQEEWVKQGLVFHSTKDIIKAANEGRLPDKIMMTFHPQKWHDRWCPWIKELVFAVSEESGQTGAFET